MRKIEGHPENPRTRPPSTRIRMLHFQKHWSQVEGRVWTSPRYQGRRCSRKKGLASARKPKAPRAEAASWMKVLRLSFTVYLPRQRIADEACEAGVETGWVGVL